MYALVSFSAGLCVVRIFDTAEDAQRAQKHWIEEGVECWVAKTI